MLSDEEREALQYFNTETRTEEMHYGAVLVKLIEKQSKEIERINEILTWKQKHEEQLQKEIEELKQNIHLKEVYVLKTNDYIKGTNIEDELCNKKWEDKIKVKIEELQEDIKYSANPLSIDNSKFGIKVLQSLLEKE